MTVKQKKKKDLVVPEMRERLRINRTGKLTPSQWMDVVMQPLVTILLLMMPFGFFILPRFVFLLWRGGLSVLIVLILLTIGSFLLRAGHYARQPIYFMKAYSRENPAPFWMFWKPLLLVDENGAVVKFGKRLAPRLLIQRGQNYLLYYMKEEGDNVLLSIAPEDHDDVQEWIPAPNFEARFKRRSKT